MKKLSKKSGFNPEIDDVFREAGRVRYQVPLGARIPESLKLELKAAARERGVTLNRHVFEVLSQHGTLKNE